MRKYLFTASLFAAMLITNISAFAAQQTISGEELVKRYSESSGNTLIYLAILVCLILVVVLIQVIDIRVKINSFKNEKAAELEVAVSGAVHQYKSSWWELFKHSSKDIKDKVKEHEYDGIREYDNNPPAWFNWLFYGSIFWAACYMLYFHVFKIGDLQIAEYDKQMKKAEIQLAAIREKAIKLADQPAYTDQAKITQGKAIFLTNCAACHGQKAEGSVGPNLTDEYWLHGGEYKDIFKTVFNGVPEKGMLAWKKSLKPDEIRSVASYINTLRGTNPPNPKAPQGDKVTIAATAPAGNGGAGSSAM